MARASRPRASSLLRRPAALLCAAGLAALLAGPLLRLAVPKPRLLNRLGFSQLVLDGSGRPLRMTLSADEKYRIWTPHSEIAPDLREAAVLYEDRWFWRHPGVNPWSLLRALGSALAPAGRRVGGSTISMQVARMALGVRSRNVPGKLEQIVRALQIELHYSKEEILEAYLNLVPYGGNVEGVGAAARIYFGKPASELNLPEALSLAVVPQSPERRSPERLALGLDAEPLIEARGRLASAWIEEKRAEGETPTLSDPAQIFFPAGVASRRDLRFLAPHFVDGTLERHRTLPLVETTLDRGLQRLLEQHVALFVQRNKRIGISNASALLVDARDMAVRALVGSADFFDREIAGQVDGTQARRSPGSTLKPFIYGLALDQGLIHPGSMLKDTPVSYASYNPENFDRDFAGPIKAGEALIRSRNVPAINLANKLAAPGMYGFLKSAHVEGLREESFYGLSLVLGGVEVSMRDLARLYAMLARGGVSRPLRFLKSDPEAAGERLLSAEAAFLVLEMLRRNPRPNQESDPSILDGTPPVYWKTGTSFGFRDAWAVGLTGQYVLAVWIGNFSGAGNPAFIGRDAAGPLFFAIADGLRSSPSFAPTPPLPPSGVRKVEVCSISGQLPGPHCGHREESWFIPGRSPIATCSIHREIELDAVSGLRRCVSREGGRREVYEFWPSDLMALFAASGVSRRAPPPFEPGCAGGPPGADPEITSPQRGVIYALRSERLGSEKIPFSAVTDADARFVYWFVDERLVGRVARGEPLLWEAQPGVFIVRAVDDLGRAGMREIKVQLSH